MKLTKAQTAILCEMLRTGEPLRYRDGPWAVGGRGTTWTLVRALEGFGLVERVQSETPRKGPASVLVDRILTDAGREAAQEKKP